MPQFSCQLTDSLIVYNCMKCICRFFFAAPAYRVFPNHLSGDQVIRENPASRGTETSAEVLVGPPLGAGGWSETPVNSSGTRLTLTPNHLSLKVSK